MLRKDKHYSMKTNPRDRMDSENRSLTIIAGVSK